MAPVMENRHREVARWEAKRKRFWASLFCVFFIPLVALIQLIAPFFCTFVFQRTRVILWVDAAINFFLAALWFRCHLQQYGLRGPLPPFEEKRPALEHGADCC